MMSTSASMGNDGWIHTKPDVDEGMQYVGMPNIAQGSCACTPIRGHGLPYAKLTEPHMTPACRD